MIEINIDKILSKPHKRAHTPTIIQTDSLECGAVCLAIILAYYGRYISPEEARISCGVTRDGSKSVNVIKAARLYGMNAYGRRIFNIDDLQFRQTPFIVFWEFEHFIVVEQVTKQKVYVNDPATGPRTMSLKEFSNGFTGVTLILEPQKDFEKGGKPDTSIFKMMFSYIKNEKVMFLYLILISVLLALPTVGTAIFAKIFIDNVMVENQSQWMPFLLGFMFFSVLLMMFMKKIQIDHIVNFQVKFLTNQTPAFALKLLSLPMRFFVQRASGDIASRFNIFMQIADILTHKFSENIINISTICLYLIFIALLEVKIAALVLVFMLVSALVVIFTRRRIVDLGCRLAKSQAKLIGIEYGGVAIIEELKFRSAERQFLNRWASYQAQTTEILQQVSLYSAFISTLPELLNYFLLIGFILMGSMLIVTGDFTAGSLVAIYTMLINFIGPLKNTIVNLLEVLQFKGDMLRIKDITDAGVVIQSKIGKQKVPAASKAFIEVRNLFFGYTLLEPPVLNDINFKINPGQSIAITGTSGTGKSTLLHLIANFFEPLSGEIFIKGRDVSKYSPEELFSIISYVDQQVMLFEGTIRENVTMWDETISDEEIYKALEIVCADKFVSDAGGLNYKIIEGGKNVSQGQAQRIELARALVRKPQLILLDETTSGLDSTTEAQIYTNLRKVNCSFIIVAHRLSTIRHCDEIIVIEEGDLVEQGTHEQLMKKKGYYYKSLNAEYLS